MEKNTIGVYEMLNTNVDLLKGNILKSLIIFAIPLFISNLFQQLYNTVDIMIVGHFLGDTSLAAIGASSPVYELLVGFALGIGNGLSMVVARSYGADDIKLLRKSVAGSIIIGCFITIIIMVIFNAIIKSIKYTGKYNRRIIFLYFNDYNICRSHVCI